MDDQDRTLRTDINTVQAARDCLGPGSAVAAALPGFAPRPQQLEMAAAVEGAIAEGRHLVVEAGTGVGKSFAYLLPALLHLAGGGEGPIVVATRTIALQEQLIERDVPFLLETLGLDELKVALAKGRGNYVCLRRLEMACTEGMDLFGDPARLRELEELRAWAHASRDGSLSTAPFRPRDDLWDHVRAEAGNCLGRRCRFFKPCAYQRSRRLMHGADLVVANHALVFADLALREAGVSVLPEYSCLILDEAHELEEGAASNFGASVSEIGIARQLGRFMGSKRRTGLFGRVEVGIELYEQLERVRKLARSFFVQLDSLRGDAKERRLRGEVGFEDGLSQPIDRLVGMLKKEHDVISDEEVAMEWKARTDRLSETRDALRLIAGQLDHDLVYWVERSGRRGRSVLRAAPDDVAPLLRRSLFSRTRCVVMTSATMRVAGRFDHFNRRVGLDEPMELAAGSPFDFQRQCRLLLHPRMPEPRQGAAFDDAVAERVRDLVLDSGGGAFVLFTSHRALAAVHDAVRGDLDAAGLKVLRQGDSRPREILEQFRSSEDCVLFGTDTFWQGVDVRGRNLRLVVLTRLPFAVPDHPLQEARLERIEDVGGDPFRELSLPQAVLKLRQGFGRLIRTQEDEGVVAILDPRTHTKSYGRIFLDSLPRCAVEER